MKTVTDETGGNCYAACISTLTGIPFDILRLDPPPSPTDAKEKSCEFNNRMNLLLRQNGWAICHMGTRIPKGYSIASGKSPRGDWDHAIVVYNGNCFFDPHPSGVFIEQIRCFEVLVRVHPRLLGE